MGVRLQSPRLQDWYRATLTVFKIHPGLQNKKNIASQFWMYTSFVYCIFKVELQKNEFIPQQL